MAEMRKVTLTINGNKYPITTVEKESYVRGMGEEIDEALQGLLSGSRLALNEALVLLCLSYLDAYKKSEKNADNLRGQIAEYLEEASRARQQAGEAQKEIRRLEERLKAKNKDGDAKAQREPQPQA